MVKNNKEKACYQLQYYQAFGIYHKHVFKK